MVLTQIYGTANHYYDISHAPKLMHRLLPKETEIMLNIELSGRIEKAWQLISEPFHMMKWMGRQFQCLELELRAGGTIVFAGSEGNINLKRFGTVVDCFPPYKLAYRYNQELDSIQQKQNFVLISLMVLPLNQCMLNVHVTGFASYAEFEAVSDYWRKALHNLQQLMTR
jgi:uncharacterized protein YndB with AHSA1/START domain